MPYAAKVENGVVTNAIVGDVEWAAESLDGEWVNAEQQVSIGYLLVDGEFRPPAPYDSWTWDGTDYQPPVPMPDPVEGYCWSWDEDVQEWVQHEVPRVEAE